MPVSNKALYDSGVYTNVQGLASLRYEYKNNAQGVKKEAAQQFESLLIQTLLKSMREANKACSSGLMSSDQSELYGDLLDKQLSMVMSKADLGLAKTIENYIDRTTGVSPTPKTSVSTLLNSASRVASTAVQASSVAAKTVAQATPTFDTAADFVKGLWGHAREAAQLIGADPKILLAQAALETSWGKKIISQQDGQSTHNLFNIKAGSSWAKDSASVNTVEEQDGVLVKENARFRSYDSFQASFVDYTRFLQQNSRYSEALKNAPDAEKFIHSLQDASYATDHRYSDKVMEIYESKKFNKLIDEMNLI
ncbi:flagellar assembly peptidoglycan hydrolase FlgJ [Legionella sp. CNM-4043-24]|uniref:flagellar assembly peptidoglycan hydrolase FlgJ n=1 Tax=Legionella sp. CNM-4043-24 TaxID=3421646 RepID=UPI00403B1737